MLDSRLSGLQTFIIVWAGQMVSAVGTSMTRFALLTYVFAETGQATALALLGFFSFILYVVFSPIAGIVIDRYDRRTIMIITDTGAGLLTVGISLLFASGNLQIWHLYVSALLTGGLQAFQEPAFYSSITMMVPKTQYGRANGLHALARYGSEVFGPVFAGVILALAGIQVVFLLDVLTFLVAVGALLLVRIPNPHTDPDDVDAVGTIWADLTFGIRYIMRRRGLLGLMLLFMLVQFIATLTYLGVLPAMILARTGGDEIALASVQAALGGAGVVGSILLSIWGGPQRQMPMLILSTAASFLFGDFLMGIGQDIPAWIIAAIATSFLIPFIVSAERTIWQKKVAPAAQGRVFAAQGMFNRLVMPFGFLITGPLADRLFEPAMQPGLLSLPTADWVLGGWSLPLADGALVDVFGGLVGTGPGAGMGLMFVGTALLGLGASIIAYIIPVIRHVEDDLPDHHDRVPEPLASMGQ